MGPAYIGTPSNPFHPEHPAIPVSGNGRGFSFRAVGAQTTWHTYLYNYDDGAEAPSDPASMGEFHRTHAVADFYFAQWCFS